MDAAPQVGIAMTWPCAAVVGIALCVAAPCMAGENYAFVVSGASGGAAYAKKYDGWRSALVSTLKSSFRYPDDHVVELPEASRERIHKALRDVQTRLMPDDQLLVALIGHGT